MEKTVFNPDAATGSTTAMTNNLNFFKTPAERINTGTFINESNKTQPRR